MVLLVVMAIVLAAHVTFAIISLVLSVGVIQATYKKKAKIAQQRVQGMWLSTLTAVLTGVVLMFMTGAIGRTCVSMFAFLGVVIAVHAYAGKHLNVSYRRSVRS